MSSDYKEQLASLNATIKAVEDGDRENRVRERYLTDVDLPTLYRRRAQLEMAVARQAGTVGQRQGVLRRRRSYRGH